MSWTSSNGEQVDTPRSDVKDPDMIRRARARAMVEMRRQGWSYRNIAEFFSGSWHPQEIKRITQKVPQEALRRRSFESVA